MILLLYFCSLCVQHPNNIPAFLHSLKSEQQDVYQPLSDGVLACVTNVRNVKIKEKEQLVCVDKKKSIHTVKVIFELGLLYDI